MVASCSTTSGAESCVQLTVVNRPIPAEEIGAKEFFRPADPRDRGVRGGVQPAS